MYADTRYLFLLIRFKYRSLFSTAVFSAKADAKIQPFSNTPKYFFKKFLSVMPTALSYSAMRLKKIFTPRGFPPRKTVLHGAKKEENPFLVAEIGHQKGKSAIYHYSSIGYPHTLTPRGASYQQSIPLGAATVPLRHFTIALQ